MSIKIKMTFTSSIETIAIKHKIMKIDLIFEENLTRHVKRDELKHDIKRSLISRNTANLLFQLYLHEYQINE